MTSRQREILAAMKPGEWMTAAAISARCSASHGTALRRLWILEDGGYVSRKANTYRRLPRGDAEAMKAPPPVAEVGARQLPKPRTRPKQKAMRRSTVPKKPKPRKKPKRRKSFSEKYKDPNGKRYGELFMIVRLLSCWLCDEGYNGPGHKVGDCAIGVQGGHTAHHVGRYDEDGMIPGGGKAHDLYAGLGGSETVAHFRGWLGSKRVSLKEVGLEYVAKAKRIKDGGGFKDTDMAW